MLVKKINIYRGDIFMIREMKEEDLQQCGVIYAKAFPIEYWGIDGISDKTPQGWKCMFF